MRLVPEVVLILLLLSCGLLTACGEPAVPTPTLHFYDGQFMPPDAETDMSGEALPDMAAETDTEADKPIICSPGLAFCHGDSVAKCSKDGTAREILDNCNDDNDCTEDGCANSVCTHDPVSQSCCQPPCEMGELCISNECICTPMCMGKECGDDGCGGTCGECPGDAECSVTGKCKCKPDCTDKECGDDGCSGLCGYCLEPAVCEEGLCICTPMCDGVTCGDDGCGGSCGDCPPVHKCIEGACQVYCPICPEINGCNMIIFGAHVYYFCLSPRKWESARDDCTANQAYLVSIGSAEENAFILEKTGGASYWIGYYQEWYTWEWTWVSGESKAFENWDKDQPDDGGFWPPEEDCAEIWGNGKWNDSECGTNYPFVCEFEPAT